MSRQDRSRWGRRVVSISFAALAPLVYAAPAIAGADVVQTAKLPKDKSVQNAYAEIVRLEPYARDWSPEWQHPVSKVEVARRVEAVLHDLDRAERANPGNLELKLLIGLAAHYAHNVDATGVVAPYDRAVKSLQEAQALAPDDLRPRWFLASLECQTPEALVPGMKSFLQLEVGRKPSDFPPGFWSDYLSCASLTRMQAHVLRAARLLGKAKTSRAQDIAIEHAIRAFKPGDPARLYAAREVWGQMGPKDASLYSAEICGIGFWGEREWKVSTLDFKDATCDIVIWSDPLTGGAGQIRPSIRLVARQPRAGQSLEQFAAERMTEGNWQDLRPLPMPECQVDGCTTVEARSPGMYAGHGDGRLIVTTFKRAAPVVSGLPFEEPQAPPTSGSKGIQYFASDSQPRLQRLDGALYYAIVLDSASGVYDEALAIYRKFLKRLVVE